MTYRVKLHNIPTKNYNETNDKVSSEDSLQNHRFHTKDPQDLDPWSTAPSEEIKSHQVHKR